MAPRLLRAWSTYKDIRMPSFYHPLTIWRRCTNGLCSHSSKLQSTHTHTNSCLPFTPKHSSILPPPTPTLPLFPSRPMCGRVLSECYLLFLFAQQPQWGEPERHRQGQQAPRQQAPDPAVVSSRSSWATFRTYCLPWTVSRHSFSARVCFSWWCSAWGTIFVFR